MEKELTCRMIRWQNQQIELFCNSVKAGQQLCSAGRVMDIVNFSLSSEKGGKEAAPKLTSEFSESGRGTVTVQKFTDNLSEAPEDFLIERRAQDSFGKVVQEKNWQSKDWNHSQLHTRRDVKHVVSGCNRSALPVTIGERVDVSGVGGDSACHQIEAMVRSGYRLTSEG